MLPADSQAPALDNPAADVEPVETSAEMPQRSEAHSADTAMLDDAMQARLSEKLNSISDSPDPVAALDAVIQATADELDHNRRAGGESMPPPGSREEVDNAIQTLVSVALELEDPVAALEDGANSLADALAAREIAIQEWQHTMHVRQLDAQAAYQHARLHRVNELIDLGYGLDQAVAITNANEAEIRARAEALGRDPVAPIYEYAVRNGYRGLHHSREARFKTPPPIQPPHSTGKEGRTLETLAAMGDEAFATATEGDRWQQLMNS